MNNRSTIIFGNGLGMALDPEYFQLKSALLEVWNDTELLSHDQKKLIQSALPNTSDSVYPEGEEQLNGLQIAIFALEFLKEYETDDVPWLNQTSRDIVSAFKKFTHQVSQYFHRSGKCLPDSFLTPLATYIKESKSHVATLNYDNLLYDPLCSKKVMSGYSGALIDGFLGTFDPSNLDRFNTSSLGWFLHLHGSPLFVGNRKHSGLGRIFSMANEECHIVLTHVVHKPLVIQTSHILNEYWTRLDKALAESDTITLFGYSGKDTHLNEAIAKNTDKKILVIEWIGAGSQEPRLDFWSKALSTCNFRLIQMSNILDFTDWSVCDQQTKVETVE